MEFINHYRILNVPVYATKAEIKSAYFERLAELKECQKPPEIIVEEAKAYNTAFVVLGNEEKRRKYDEALWRHFSENGFYQDTNRQTKTPRSRQDYTVIRVY